MRIWHFITPSQIGGAEVHLLDLCRKLTGRGHQVAVVCPRGRALTAELRRRGFEVWAPRTTGKFDPLTLLRLAARLRRQQVDVIHTHLSTASLIGSLAARLAGLPAVATVHGLNRRTCFLYAHRIIAVSHAVRQHLVEQGVPEARLRVIYNGVDLARYQRPPDPAPLRAALGLAPGEALIGSVGRLSPEKGHLHLIRAAAILAQRDRLALRVLLVGAGRHRPALEQAARRCGMAERVIFAGFQRDVMSYQAALDVFCLPSLREGLSLSALEAMALRRPVVASRVGGVPELIVDGESGLLVEPGNAQALADALARLLRDPEAARRIGEAGRRRVEQMFCLDRTAGQVEQVYREVCESASLR